MKHASELRAILSHFFDWHKCRLDCLGQIIQALFIVRTINLTQVASAFKSEVKQESSYRRVCRFFTGFTFDMIRIVLLVFRLFPLGDKFTLILDRTNRKWGKTPINILMLSIAYRGIGIPLFRVVLNLEGNSCAEDRIDLLKRVVERLGISRIEVLLADRDFIRNALVLLSDRTEDSVHHQGQTEFHGRNRRARQTPDRTPTEMALTKKSCEPSH